MNLRMIIAEILSQLFVERFCLVLSMQPNRLGVEVWENEKSNFLFSQAFTRCFYNKWEYAKKCFFYYNIAHIENLNVEIVFFTKA